MEATAGVDRPGGTDLLEKVVDGGFQPEILQGGWHQAMGDVPDELDGIVDDLFGVVNALQLGADILLEEVLVQVETRRGQQGPGIIVEIGRNALPLLLLPADGCIQQDLLLLLFHLLELQLIPEDLPLVENNEYNQGNG